MGPRVARGSRLRASKVDSENSESSTRPAFWSAETRESTPGRKVGSIKTEAASSQVAVNQFASIEITAETAKKATEFLRCAETGRPAMRLLTTQIRWTPVKSTLLAAGARQKTPNSARVAKRCLQKQVTAKTFDKRCRSAGRLAADRQKGSRRRTHAPDSEAYDWRASPSSPSWRTRRSHVDRIAPVACRRSGNCVLIEM